MSRTRAPLRGRQHPHRGKLWLTDAGHGRTDVTIQNWAHVGGLLGHLVSRGTIRDRQRNKLRTDLTDLQKAARRQLVASAATGKR